MGAACPKCGFSYAWDGSTCQHCVTPTLPEVVSTPAQYFTRWLVVSLVILGIAASVCWFCWPGQFSAFNIWRIGPGMTLERVEWLLGRPGEELTEEQVPIRQRHGRAVSGERYYRWQADPIGWRRGDYLIVSFEAGIVKETYYWEVPLS